MRIHIQRKLKCEIILCPKLDLKKKINVMYYALMLSHQASANVKSWPTQS